MTRTTLRTCWTLLAVIAVASVAFADVKLPKIFSDHMLLQRSLAVPVWGWAEHGERVTVRFADQEHQTQADGQGRWMVRLQPLAASDTGRPLEIVGTNRVVLQDVLVGDVWICSGQSNMEWPVKASLNSEQEIAAAQFPLIRLFDVLGHTTSRTPNDDVRGGSRQLCSPESVAGFSAVGYYFGRDIHRKTGVPVGLIGTNWGGTRIEPWTPPAGFRSVAELKEIADQVDQFDPAIPQGRVTWESYVTNLEAYAAQARTALNAGTSLPEPVATPGFHAGGQPTTIYNSMVHGLAPYGLRGAIWYQGESNGEEGVSYFHKMQALIDGWRLVWNQSDFPIYFYFVQLADWKEPNDNPAGGDGWAKLREAQRQTLTVPHTGMAVITDIGNAGDIHPRNKQDVGARLARWARRDVADQEIVVSGPLYREMKVEGSTIRLYFDHTGQGLMVGKRKAGLEPTQEDLQGKLQRFAIAGSDQQWHWADAQIDGNSVVVSSGAVPEPVAVRYGYTMNPAGANLYNRAGLPASPFRTDDW